MERRDPLVASRVRSLMIYPKAVRSACLRSSKGRSTSRWHSTATNQHWPSYFQQVLSSYSKIPGSWISSHQSPIAEDVEFADRFLAALANLNYIEEYIIEWKQSVEAERPFWLPLLLAIWPLYGHNLRVIKLDMMLTTLCDMLGSVTGLDRVQQLSISCWDFRESEAKDAFERLATFIIRLSLTLQSLTLSSIGHFNFSWLYCNLSYFPHLTYLALLLPCDPHHFVDPTALHHFLRSHHTIEHLKFFWYCSCQSSLQFESNATFMSTDDRLNRCFTGITFQYLHQLDLGHRPTCTRAWGPCTWCELARSARTGTTWSDLQLGS